MTKKGEKVTLFGRILLRGDIHLLSGLHVGGAAGTLAIGNYSPVIRNVMTGRPYIPGSSLKGKMRSLSEKLESAPLYPLINNLQLHIAQNLDEYNKYSVNKIFGVPSDQDYIVPFPSRLIVRDVQLSDASAETLDKLKTDLPYGEIKWEAVIDRITSAATPRQIERVPAGAIFSPMELVFSVYKASDFELFKNVITALQLVEDDYLGGHGSRGSGKVEFKSLMVIPKAGATYSNTDTKSFDDLKSIAKDETLTTWLTKCIPTIDKAS